MGGLRGGISVALVFSIPPVPERHVILAVTYAVVLFSFLVQGLTIEKLVKRIVSTGDAWHPETFEKRSVLFKFKKGENFKRRNTLRILRINPPRRLKFEPDAEIGQKGAFCKGLILKQVT